MLYKNTRTGAVLDSPYKISGGDWVPAEDAGKEAKNEETPKKEEIKEEPVKDDGLDDGLTKEEIINELEALGIEFDKKAKKEDLYKLLMEG